MNVFLLYKDKDFDPAQQLPWNEQDLIKDLELTALFNSMADDDEFLLNVASRTILTGLDCNLETILYRQEILIDCIDNPIIIRDLYSLAIEAIENERKNYWGMFNSKWPSYVLHRSLDVMKMFIVMLKKLRELSAGNYDKFRSEGFRRFFKMLTEELSDEYFNEIRLHLESLKFRDGILVSTRIADGNKGSGYLLHKPQPHKQGWLLKILGDYLYRQNLDGKLLWLSRFIKKDDGSYTFYLSPRDDSGIRALSQLKDEGINSVANTLAQSCDHILGFFKMLKTEIGFYVGALNLHKQLSGLGEPVCFPVPVDNGRLTYTSEELYDACLALTKKKQVVGNDINADQKKLVIITGANQGGKSTFLRSIGLSQMMMQCGMFVPAVSYSANISDSLLTHFRREEDTTMTSGKLDEELDRMNNIINNIKNNSLILFNESFSATNEREGSEIAGQIVSALLGRNIKIFFVTHLYEFAYGFFSRKKDFYLFLQAEREADTTRTFKITEGEPQQTSFGGDLYSRIFSSD